jgi:hypothetical protein
MLGVHSMTSSARASSDGGTIMRRVLAVLRLMINWNFLVEIIQYLAGDQDQGQALPASSRYDRPCPRL